MAEQFWTYVYDHPWLSFIGLVTLGALAVCFISDWRRISRNFDL